MTLDAKRIINGTFGEVWLDDIKASEAYGLQAKIDIEKEDINICGQLAGDSKMTGWKGKGSIKFHKVNSRIALKIATMLKNGQEVRFTIISKLKDPDSYGSERIAIKNVSFDDFTLADWEVKKPGETEHPFTFTDFTLLDTIEPVD